MTFPIPCPLKRDNLMHLGTPFIAILAPTFFPCHNWIGNMHGPTPIPIPYRLIGAELNPTPSLWHAEQKPVPLQR